jgi:hypothetical protein
LVFNGPEGTNFFLQYEIGIYLLDFVTRIRIRRAGLNDLRVRRTRQQRGYETR